MKLGMVGLPNVGKSTLFNAITNYSYNIIVYYTAYIGNYQLQSVVLS